MELLKKTSVPVKYSTDGLSHIELNDINSTLNNTVDAVNQLILNRNFNVNVEFNNYSKIYSLEEVLDLIPIDRRILGMELKFLSNTNEYSIYIYTGTDLEDLTWKSLDNWTIPNKLKIIDGGKW